MVFISLKITIKTVEYLSKGMNSASIYMQLSSGKTLTFFSVLEKFSGDTVPRFFCVGPQRPPSLLSCFSPEDRCTVVIMVVSTITSGNTNAGESGTSGKISARRSL